MVVARYLDTWDYVTMVTLVVASSTFGFYRILTAKKIKNPQSFVVSGEGIGLVPLILSITATSSSAVQILAFPVETYFNGVSFLLFALICFLVAPFSSHLYLPVFFQSNISTTFEYLELRFNKSTRMLASLAISVQTLFYAATATYAPALVIHQVTGLHLWTTIIIIAVICLLYTSLGGFTAVIWADVLQCIVAIGVLILLIVKGTVDTGGPEAVWENLKAGNRTDFFVNSSSTNSRYSSWTLAIGGYFFFGSYYASHQLNMQRYLSNKTLFKAKMSVYGGAVGFMVCHVLYAAVGLVMYAYYHNCDPILERRIKVRDQSVALFAVDVLSDYKGLNGVFIGGLMCATLSSISSYLNMLAAVTVSDYVPVFKPNLSDRALKNISKISVLVFGVVCVALVVLIENMGNIAKIMFSIYGVAAGAVFTTFTVGMLLPWVNSKGAICGFIGSTVIPFWSFIGSYVKPQLLHNAPLSVEGCSNFSSGFNFTEKIVLKKTVLDQVFSMSSYWYPLVSLTSGLVISLIANYAMGFQDPRSIDPKLLFIFVKKLVYWKKLRQPQDTSTLEDDVNRPAEIPLLELKNQVK